jgi:glycosyltransferase involved in cell wall biosynthesis
MRITFVLENADLAGGVRVVAIYAQKLQQRGHRVTVVSTPNVVLPWHLRVHSLLKGRGWPTPGPLGSSHLDGTNVEHRILPEYRAVTDADVPDADVIVATTWRTGEWINRLSPSKGAKAHLMQHYEDWAGPGAVEGVKRVWRMPSHKIVISKWLAELARERFGIDDASHVPNSVDMDQFNAPPRGKQEWPTVGMLYHDVAFKGIDVSLKAIAAAREIMPQLRLIAYGRDEPTSALPLPAGTTFIRRPVQEKIREVYAACDVWMCGSRAEGFHLPPLEAMACRTPVVSTRVGGPMDIIEDGVNGYLVDIEDWKSLARRVVDVVNLAPEQWKKMSDAAYMTAQRYTWDDATNLFEAALELAIRKVRGNTAVPALLRERFVARATSP